MSSQKEIGMKRAILTAAATLSIGLLSFGLAATSASAQETKCEPDKLATKYPSLVGKTINLAQDGESPPFSFRDPKDFDHIVGMDTELAEAVFKCAGVPIKIVTAGWSGLLPSVISGQTDVDFVTYMVAATGALVAKGNPQNIHSMADACGKRATAGLATVEEAAFRDQAAKCIAAGKPDISIVTYPDIPGGTRLIQNDRADVMLSGLSVVNALVAQNPNAFELGYTIVTDYKVSAAVTRGNKDLAKLIYDGLKIAMADGSYKTIIEKYGFSMSLALKPEILTQ
jgi:polar amino acid transport system substrate-binding protein